ncbi:alkaline phosphatase family protein [Halosimplex sp. J119]
MDSPDTLVFGIDGAHFELIEPWIEQGELPNLEQQIESGICGDLESVLPPVTSPNWKAYMTGRNPGKIGIFWWENIDVDQKRIYYPSERKNSLTEFWELISQHTPVGVIGVPTTYPPKDVNGYVVAGAPDGQNTGFASPASFEQTLNRELNYRVTNKHNISEDIDRAATEILDLIESRYEAAEIMLEQENIGFLQITTFYINVLQHYLWDHKYTLKGWKIIDEYIGKLDSKDTNTIFMSDHGSTEIDTVFHINDWLDSSGYLNTNLKTQKALHKIGLSRERIGEVAARLGIFDLAKNHTPEKILNKLPDESGTINHGAKEESIDWESSKAIASGQGPVYMISKDGKDEKELTQELEKLNIEKEEKLLEGIHKKQNIYSGKYLDQAPDLIIDQKSGTHIPGSIGSDDIVTHPEDSGWKAENKKTGLFVANGPDFGETEGERIDISILDLAPTLLHLHGLSIPNDYDGQVRKDVFSHSSPAMESEVEFTDSISREVLEHHTDNDLEDRLEDLGYLD